MSADDMIAAVSQCPVLGREGVHRLAGWRQSVEYDRVSQCPVLGREGVHLSACWTYARTQHESLNAPCWGARVCTS